MAAAILDGAAELLITSGPSSLSVRAIAERANVAPMGVYNHFGDKAGVLDHLYQRGANAFEAALAVSALLDDPLEAMRMLGRRYRQFAIEHTAEFTLLFLQPIAGYEPSSASKLAVENAFEIFVTTITRCQAIGVMVQGDATVLAQFIWASIHGFVLLEQTSWSKVADPMSNQDFEVFLDHLGFGFLTR